MMVRSGSDGRAILLMVRMASVNHPHRSSLVQDVSISAFFHLFVIIAIMEFVEADGDVLKAFISMSDRSNLKHQTSLLAATTGGIHAHSVPSQYRRLCDRAQDILRPRSGKLSVNGQCPTSACIDILVHY